MKRLVLVLALVVGIPIHGQDTKEDENPLLSAFQTDTAKVLKQPFSGKMKTVYASRPKDEEAKMKDVLLNFLSPADTRGHSPIRTPYLATTEDGRSYWGAFALREALPDTKKLASFSSYKEILDLLGPPTHLPFSGEVDEKWSYDGVSWRLFRPLDANKIEVLVVGVYRKYPHGAFKDSQYLIESYEVQRGILTKGEQKADKP